MLDHSHVLLLIVHGDDKARQLGGHIWPHTGESHLQDVDWSTVDKVLQYIHGRGRNKLRQITGTRDSLIYNHVKQK